METRISNSLDPEYRSRSVFSFHQPDILAKWLREIEAVPSNIAAHRQEIYGKPKTLRYRLRQMPPLAEEGLWASQIEAVKGLETSLAENRPRALIQMATGSGKTFTAINFIYRLIKFAGARRILFLVDRGNLGRQTLKEFQQYLSPYYYETYFVFIILFRAKL